MKRHYIYIVFTLILALLINLAFSSCGGNTNQTDGTKLLRLRLTEDIGNLDPVSISGGVDDTVDRAVMEGLVRYKPGTKELENVLAESYTVSDDGLTIDFKLRQGIKWQKGYGEFTAYDVKFSFERFIDPALASDYAGDWEALDHVDAVGKYEVKIFLKHPQVTLWTTTLPLTSGLIICKKQYEEIGKDKFATNIVGTGPYIFDSWQPGQQVTLKKNVNYWGDKPTWDEIQLKPVTDDSAAEIALQAGELDFGKISLASGDRFAKIPNFKTMTLQTNTYDWVGMNIENPKLQDINVRLAIRYGIDVPAILNAAYAGKAEQAGAILPSNILGYWKDAPIYKRDAAKAKDYMTKAGLSKLDLNLTTIDTVEFRSWAEIIQQNLAEVGINITIVPIDDTSFWDVGKGDKGKDLELFTMYFTSMSDPAWFTMWFTSGQIGEWNWMRWNSPQYDALYKQGLTISDPDQRAQIYIQMQQLWDQNVNSVWITHQPLAYAYSPKIKPVMDSNGIIPMLRDFTKV